VSSIYVPALVLRGTDFPNKLSGKMTRMRSSNNGGRALTSLALGVVKYLTAFYLGIQVGLLYTTTTSDSNDSSILASLIAMPALQRINDDVPVSVVSSPQSLSKEACAVLTTKLMKEDGGGITLLKGSTYSIYLYKSNDIVSDSILKTGQWAAQQMTDLHEALSNFANKMKLPPNDVVFLDIGANVGSYSLSMASHGYSVIAFEAFIDNIELIQASICENNFEDLISLHGKGLGADPSICIVYSHVLNVGDGHTKCGVEQKTIVNDTFFHEGNEYKVRGHIESVRLDDVVLPRIRSKIGAVKMDVEGYETHVLHGGQEVLLRSKIPYIFTEFSPGMIRDKGGDPASFVKAFIDAGYVAQLSLNGPQLAVDDIDHEEIWFILL
jgi:FkbM family methyltransferase